MLSAAGLFVFCLAGHFIAPAAISVAAAENDPKDQKDQKAPEAGDATTAAEKKPAAAVDEKKPAEGSNTAEGSTTAKGTSTRLVMGMGSAEKVLSSLEYLVDKLAGKNRAWINNIQPNLEIFLIGVSTELPVRFDMILDPKHGGQMQTIVPIADLNEFLADNLEPIDIIAEQDRKDRNLYELTGTVYEGWLRYLPKPTPYAIFFPQKEALPKDMPHPEVQHQDLAENVAFLWQKNSAEHSADRIASF
jgi:hypothetical protein